VVLMRILQVNLLVFISNINSLLFFCSGSSVVITQSSWIKNDQ
jgi:hypothetical protein